MLFDVRFDLMRGHTGERLRKQREAQQAFAKARNLVYTPWKARTLPITLSSIPGAAHVVLRGQPQAVNAAIKEWIQQH